MRRESAYVVIRAQTQTPDMGSGLWVWCKLDKIMSWEQCHTSKAVPKII